MDSTFNNSNLIDDNEDEFSDELLSWVLMNPLHSSSTSCSSMMTSESQLLLPEFKVWFIFKVKILIFFQLSPNKESDTRHPMEYDLDTALNLETGYYASSISTNSKKKKRRDDASISDSEKVAAQEDYNNVNTSYFFYYFTN